MSWFKFRTALGFGPSMLLAECTQCQTVMAPGGRECLNCKAAFPENSVIRKLTARDAPREDVEGFVSCPGCGRLLRPGVETCPECGADVTREYAARSVEANVAVGQAYGVAQRIGSFNPAAFVVLALSALIVGSAVFDPASPGLIPAPVYVVGLLALCAWQLFTITRWFRWFGSYESSDEEFAAARHKVEGALRLWLAVLGALVVGLAVSWWLR